MCFRDFTHDAAESVTTALDYIPNARFYQFDSHSAQFEGLGRHKHEMTANRLYCRGRSNWLKKRSTTGLVFHFDEPFLGCLSGSRLVILVFCSFKVMYCVRKVSHGSSRVNKISTSSSTTLLEVNARAKLYSLQVLVYICSFSEARLFKWHLQLQLNYSAAIDFKSFSLYAKNGYQLRRPTSFLIYLL